MGGAVQRSVPLTLLPFPLALRWSALGLFFLIATASLFLAGPQIQVDEGSYLLTAATLAGQLAENGVNGYYSGYSLLLLPAFLLGSHPDRIFHGVLVINALLIATTPFALFRLTSLLNAEVDKNVHVAAAVAATVYAPLLLVSQHAMSESALVPMYAWLLATGAAALVTQKLTQAVCFGVLAGALLLVHPRGAAIAAPVVAIVGAFSLCHSSGRRVALAILIAAIAVAALHAPLETFAGKDVALGSSYSPTKVIDRLFDATTWFWIALNALGSTTEAIVTSLGIFAVGACSIIADRYRDLIVARRAMTAQAAMTWAILIGAAVGFLMSAVFFVPPFRADHVAYGRYALPTVVPVLALGFVGVANPRIRRMRLLVCAFALSLICLGLMAFAFTRLPSALTLTWNYVNAPALYIAQDLVRFKNPWTSIGVCFLVLASVLAACMLRSVRAGFAYFASVSLLIAGLAWVYLVRPQSLFYEQQRRIESATNAFESATSARLCLTMSGALDIWQAIDLRWQIFPQLAAHQSGAVGCVRGMVELVSGADPVKSGLHLIELAPSPGNRALIAGLFVESGPALSQWTQSHPPPPLESFAPLPPSEWFADIEIHDANAIPAQIKRGDTFDISVAITHAGAGSRWSPFQYGEYPVLVGVRVTPIDSDRAVGEYRTPLVSTLTSGQTGMATIRVGPFSERGHYRARVGMVQEHIAWFAGSKEIEFDVDGP